MRFSVIVPVRNMERTIERTIRSIIRQNYKNVEIVVVDGQSHDQTLQRIEHYSCHIDALISEPDAGLYEAINKGITRSTGDIVAILNGDDYYPHADVFRQYSKSFSEEDVGVVFGDLEFFPPGNPDSTIRAYSSKGFKPHHLRIGKMPPHPTVMMRRWVYDRVGLYRTDFRISSDFELLLRALLIAGVPYRRLDSVVVRMQYGGLSTQGLKATALLNREIIRACRENGIKSGWLRLATKVPSKIKEFYPLISGAIRGKSRSSTSSKSVAVIANNYPE